MLWKLATIKIGGIKLDMIDNTPQELIEAMRNALSRGNLPKAQELSIEAVNRYPDNEDIKKCAYVLAPTKVTVRQRDDIQHLSLKKSRDWVRHQRRTRNYLNQWVAVRDGKLLATGSSIDALFDQINDINNVFFTVIY